MNLRVRDSRGMNFSRFNELEAFGPDIENLVKVGDSLNLSSKWKCVVLQVATFHLLWIDLDEFQVFRFMLAHLISLS